MLQKSTKINLLYRSSRQRCSIIKVFLKIPQNSLTGKTCVEVSIIRDFNTSLKQMFSCEFDEILRTPVFLQNTSWRLLLFVIHLLSFILLISLIYIFSKLLLLEKSTKTHNLSVSFICKYILYSILWLCFIDQKIHTRKSVNSKDLPTVSTCLKNWS